MASGIRVIDRLQDMADVVIATPLNGQFLTFNSTNSKWENSTLSIDLSAKADKVNSATNGNFAGLNTSGNLTDSGFSSFSFAALSHTHTVSNITDFPTTWSWNNLTNVPLTFPPSSHTHSSSDISDLNTAFVLTGGSYSNPSWITGLAGSKVSGNISGNAASITGSIAQSQVADLTTDLGNKAPLASPTFTGVVSAPQFTSTIVTGTSPFTVASSTLVANLNADKLDGLDSSAFEVPITFSTGLTRNINTVTVDSTQNITKLSNLTSNGFIKSSNSDGTLIIDTNTYLTAESDTLNSVTTRGATTSNVITSTVSSGTAPLVIASSTVVNNLNADKLDGQEGNYYTNASNLASGVVPTARLGTGTASSTTVLYGDNTWKAVVSSEWIVSGSDIYYSTGNVGINKNNPSEKLEVVGNVKAITFISTQTTGTSPLSVLSTTLVANLNADKLDGQEGSYYAVDANVLKLDQTIPQITTGTFTFPNIKSSGLTSGYLPVIGTDGLLQNASSSGFVKISSGVLSYDTNTYLTSESDTLSSVTGRGSTTGSVITSTVVSGTAPFIIASNTLVTNLNADKLDGLDSSAFEVPITFSTGLTRNINTVTVDSTQNITKLSNLTSNGFIKSSNSDGTLIIDTNTYLTAESDTLNSVTTRGATTSNVITSTVSSGTAPLIVASSTVVSNLNADLLDGQHSSAFANATHTHVTSDIVGFSTMSFIRITGNTTLNSSNHVVECYGNSAPFNVTLPLASLNLGKVYYLKKTDNTDNIVDIITSGSDTIDSISNYPLELNNEFVALISDGINNWLVLAE